MFPYQGRENFKCNIFYKILYQNHKINILKDHTYTTPTQNQKPFSSPRHKRPWDKGPHDVDYENRLFPGPWHSQIYTWTPTKDWTGRSV